MHHQHSSYLRTLHNGLRRHHLLDSPSQHLQWPGALSRRHPRFDSYDAPPSGTLKIHTRGDSSSPSGRSRSTGDGEFQPLQDDSSELCLRPVGPQHKVGVAVQNPTQPREIRRGSEDSLEAGESRDIYQMQNGGLGISVKQEWAVLHGQK